MTYFGNITDDKDYNKLYQQQCVVNNFYTTLQRKQRQRAAAPHRRGVESIEEAELRRVEAGSRE